MSDGKDGKDAARPDLSIGPQARGEQESAITQETDTVDSIVSRMPPLTVESAVKGLTLRGSFTGTTRYAALCKAFISPPLLKTIALLMLQ